MPLQLIKLHAFPNEIAATETGTVVEDGAFFLDFSRPLKRIRWFGVENFRFGFTVGLLVPIVHQGENSGGYVVGVHMSNPYFADIKALWKVHFPTKRTPPATLQDGLKIVSDFGTQFSESCG